MISFLETPKIRDTPVVKYAVSRRSPVDVATHEFEWPGQRLVCIVPAVRTRHQLRRLMENGVRVVSCDTRAKGGRAGGPYLKNSG
jgi:hypothetical protein